MNSNKTFLLLFGFDENAEPSDEELNTAYRKLSLKLHPDTGGSAESFRAIQLIRDQLKASCQSAQAKRHHSTTFKSSTTNASKGSSFERQYNYFYDNDGYEYYSKTGEDYGKYESKLIAEVRRLQKEAIRQSPWISRVDKITFLIKHHGHTIGVQINRKGAVDSIGMERTNRSKRYFYFSLIYKAVKDLKIENRSYFNAKFDVPGSGMLYLLVETKLLGFL